MNKDRRRKNKQLLIDYKGGKCQICDYDRCVDALVFHHKDPKTKEIGVGEARSWNLERAKKEADKCILVCNRCHKEIHAGLIQV